jgi:hypothetical protein
MFANTKALKIPQGDVVKIEANGVVLWEMPSSYTNQVPISINSDGTIFNGVGYQHGLRLSSGGTTKDKGRSVVTGFIKAKGGDIVRVAGVNWIHPNSANYINAYTSTFAHIGARTSQGTNYGTTMVSSMEADGEMAIIKLASLDNIAYIRVSSCGDDSVQAQGSEMIVTINEEIS